MYRCGLDKDIPVTFNEAIEAYRTLTAYLSESGWRPVNPNLPEGNWDTPGGICTCSRNQAILRQFSYDYDHSVPSGAPGNLEDGA